MDNGDRVKKLSKYSLFKVSLKREGVDKCMGNVIQEGYEYFEFPLQDQYPQLLHVLFSHKNG